MSNFDLDFELAMQEIKQERQIKATVQAHRRQSRRIARRAASSAALASVWPERLENNFSYHFISQGDVDSLTYLELILAAHRLDYLLFSTWCMALEDVAFLEKQIKMGNIGRLDAYVGEIFPNQYTDEYDLLCDLVKSCGGRVAVFRNHSKIFAGTGRDLDFVIESSANINTNPRAEQTAVHCDRDLFYFYKSFFDGIRSFNRNFDEWGPYDR